MSIQGHGHKKYITGACLSSSSHIGWDNLLAERWRHGEGKLRDIKPEDTEVAILLSGHVEVERRGAGELQKCNATSGTVWICPAGVQEEDIRLFGNMDDVLHLYLSSKLFEDDALREFDLDPSNLELRYDGGFHNGFIEQIGRMIAAEMEDPSPASHLLVDSLRVSLAAHLLCNHSSLSRSQIALPSTKGALDKSRLNRVIDFVANNLHRNISLGEMAKEACLSPHHFSRTFKNTVGIPPHQYVTAQKLNLAKKLIADKRNTFVNIAFKSGFSSQAHFIKAFKRETGLTPSTYRSTLL